MMTYEKVGKLKKFAMQARGAARIPCGHVACCFAFPGACKRVTVGGWAEGCRAVTAAMFRVNLFAVCCISHEP